MTISALTDALFKDFRMPYPLRPEHAQAYCLGRSQQAYEAKDPAAGYLWSERARAAAEVAEAARIERECYLPALMAAREQYTPERFSAAVTARRFLARQENFAWAALEDMDAETHGRIWYAADPVKGAVKVRCKGGVARLFETGEVVDYPDRALRQNAFAAAEAAARMAARA